MNKPDPAQLHERLGLNLVLLARLYRREMDSSLKMHGLSEAGILPLRYLARLGKGVRQGVLAEALNLEGPSLIRVLNHLEERGLITRRDDPGDRRGKIIALSAEGVAFNGRLDADLSVIRSRLFDGVAEADLAAGLRLFDAMNANIQTAREGARAEPAG